MGIKDTMKVLASAKSQLVDAALIASLGQDEDRISNAAVVAAVHHPTAEVAHALIENYGQFDEATRELIARSVYRFHSWFMDRAQNGSPEDKEVLLELLDRHTGVDALDLQVAFLSSDDATTRRRVEEMVRITVDEFIEKNEGKELSTNDKDLTTILRALKYGLETLPFHQSESIVRGAVRLGNHGYRIINESLKREGRVDSSKEAIIDALIADSSGPAIKYCFSLISHEMVYFRRIGQAIFRAKRGVGQEKAVLAVLEKMTPEAKRKLAKVNHGPIWLEVFEHRTHLLGAVELTKLAEQLDTLEERDEVKLRYWALLTDADDDALSEKAMQRITDMNSKEARELLVSLLESPRESVQLLVIRALESMRHKDILKLLAPKVASENEAVRRTASRIVADISFNRYIAAFDRLDEKTREVAGKAVLELDHDVVHRLALEMQAIDPVQRLKAVRIIEAMGSAHHVESAVLSLVNDPDKKVRATIIHLLAAMKNTHAVKALVRLLSDKDARVQANVLEAMEELNRPEFRQMIVPYLRSPNNRVKANACHALWALGVHKVALFMFEMLKSSSKRMRVSGAWVIGETKPENGLKALNEALARESVLECKSAMRRAMKRFDEAAGSLEAEGAK